MGQEEIEGSVKIKEFVTGKMRQRGDFTDLRTDIRIVEWLYKYSETAQKYGFDDARLEITSLEKGIN
ncbi:unnamed protein product [Rhizophagus irregularis]|nr:unnamed protein product [Rhizophagus irregularis]